MTTPEQPGTGWHGARRELAVAAGLILAVAVAGWVVDGPAAASLVVLICVAAGLIVLHALVTPGDPPARREVDHQAHQAGRAGLAHQLGLAYSFTGFWRTRSDLISATKSLAAWDHSARLRLQNLLAARLSERHGVSLAQDPETARRLLVGQSGHGDLWFWIDPQRPSPPDATSRPGIPPKVLAALIDRLEHL